MNSKQKKGDSALKKKLVSNEKARNRMQIYHQKLHADEDKREEVKLKDRFRKIMLMIWGKQHKQCPK